MSVINCFRSADGLSLFSDGAAYNDLGEVVAIASKVIILPIFQLQP
jgi:hypothetical protein